MKYQRRIFISIFWVVLGAALVGCAVFDLIDSFWSGMGGGLIAVGIMQIIKHVRYNSNEEYRENIDIENSDERNKFLAGRAWSFAGYILVMLMCAATIGFRIAGYDELSTFAGFTVCLVLVLYWGSYMVLRKKY